MFQFIKKHILDYYAFFTMVRFSESLASNSKGRIRCVSLSNQLCPTRSTLVDINPNETVF